MKQITQQTLIIGSIIPWATPDVDARPVLVRAQEGSVSPIIFIEHDSATPTPGWLVLSLSVIRSNFVYPGPNFRYFSSCLSPDATEMWHGLYRVDSTTYPSRMTQPELPGPIGPPGLLGRSCTCSH